jgi:hypothetical protein
MRGIYHCVCGFYEGNLLKMNCLHGEPALIPQQAMDPFGFVVKTLPAISSVLKMKVICLRRP